MEKNVFVKKYNPDVSNLYNNKVIESNGLQKDKIDYKKETWKGITGNSFTNDVKKAEDFIIEFEKPNFEAIRMEYSNRYMERQQEIRMAEEKKRKIQELAMQNLSKMQPDLDLNKKEEIKTHNELKQLQINDTDVLKDEKEKFNELLKNIDELIN